MIETLLAGLTLGVCAFFGLRLLVGQRRRARLDYWLRRQADGARRAARRAVHWRSSRKASVDAANAAIRRARGGTWDGNVYKPRTFRRPRKPH